MKATTKKDVVSAIRKLIVDYKNGNDDKIHCVDNCQLCAAYYDFVTKKKFGHGFKSIYCCNCVNTIFITGEMTSVFGCCERGMDYKSLCFDFPSNNQNLAKYWRDVLNLIIATPSKDVLELSEEFKTNVLKIAETFNN